MSIKKYNQAFICMLLIFSFLTACNTQTGARTLPTGKDATWNLVVIGDSSLWGLGKAMAKQIAADLGVKVELFDATLGGLSAGRVRNALEKGDPENYTLSKLKNELKEAEYVVMFVNPTDSEVAGKPIELDGCFYSLTKPGACDLERWTRYITDMEFIWKKIIELRAGQPTILRATDIYNPLLVLWQKNGVVDDCNNCWVNMSLAAQQAAKNAGVPFFYRFDAFNGSNHLEDPRAKGYILEDGEHPTTLASEYSAKLLAEMGYEPTIPK